METQKMNKGTGTASKFVVTTEVALAGAVAYWRLGGATDSAVLQAAWLSAGLDAKVLPKNPSYKTALTRALRAQETSTRKLVKASGFWAMLDVTADAQGVVATQQRLKANATGESIHIDGMDDSTVTRDLVAAVRAQFDHELTQLAASDVSMWLTQLANTSLATSLRESGGVYFLPQPAVAKWQTIANVLMNLGHAVFLIPAMRTDEAVAAILDSIVQEADAMARNVAAELAQPLDAAGTLGARALSTKLRECDALANKIFAYEDLLQTDLDSLADKIARLRDAIGARRAAVEGTATNLEAVSAALAVNV